MRLTTILLLLALLGFVAVIRGEDETETETELYEDDDSPRSISSYECSTTEFQLELEEESSRKRSVETDETTDETYETEDTEEDDEDEDEEETELHFRIKFEDSGKLVYEAQAEGSVSGVSFDSKVRVKFGRVGVYDVADGVATLATDCSVEEWSIDCPTSDPTDSVIFDVNSVVPAGLTLSNSFVTSVTDDGQLPSQAEVLISATFDDLCPGATLAAGQYFCISVDVVSASEQEDEDGSDESAVIAGQSLFKWAETDQDGSKISRYSLDGASTAAEESDDDDFSVTSTLVFCPQLDGTAVNRITFWDPTLQIDRSSDATTLVASLLALLL